MPFSPTRALAALDGLIARQLDAILAHPELHAMRRAWLALHAVVERVDRQEGVKLVVLSCTKGELRADLDEGGGAALARLLDTLVYEPAAPADAAPFGLVVSDHEVAIDDPDDVALLDRLATLAARVHAPWLVPTSLAEPHASFAALRERDESMYLGLCLSHLVLDGGIRLPGPHAIAVLSARSFAAYRWCPNMVREVDGRLEGVIGVEPPLSSDGAAPSSALDACASTMPLPSEVRTVIDLTVPATVVGRCDSTTSTMGLPYELWSGMGVTAVLAVNEPWTIVAGGCGEACAIPCLEGYQEFQPTTCLGSYARQFGIATDVVDPPDAELLVDLADEIAVPCCPWQCEG